MITKRTTKKAPAEVGANTVQAVDSASTAVEIEDARVGDRYALAMLYGRAAAWLNAGKVPPPTLRSWIAEVLQDLHALAWSEYRAPAGKKIDEKNRQRLLAKATKFARGRGSPKSRSSANDELNIARDFFHALTFDGAQSHEQALEMVTGYRRRYGLPEVSEDQIQAAWKKYRRQFPELRTVRSKA